MLLKWGIACVGNISHDFVTALSTLPREEHSVVAVAARNIEKAKEFADRHSIGAVYEGYEALAKDTNVDVVYIGTINSEHFKLSKLFLDNGKHVLCEKPLCVNVRDTKNLLEYARSKNLLLMEGIWSRFFPAYTYIERQIKSGNLGDLKLLEAEFGYPLNYKYGPEAKITGGGTLVDLGIYPVQLALFLFNNEVPEKVEATAAFNEHGIDVIIDKILHFKNGAVAHLKSSGMQLLGNKATIHGTKGKIEITDFWCAVSLIDIDGSAKEWPLPSATQKFNYPNSCGLKYEAEAVRQALMQGLIEVPKMTHEDSIRLAELQERFKLIIGIKYETDN
uniref:Trans-1,2-dihydrobenzene-1,2-diol dehydrogenase n=1 Tax=Culicoides sonorensis TaxID=179676 RepID=A0A336LLD2_CULSO